MARKTIQQQLTKANVVLHQDYSSKIKPADVYSLRLGHKSLDTPVSVKMTLPAGDYFIVAQAFISAGTAGQGGPFAFSLSYRQGSKTVTDEVIGTFVPPSPAYNALLSCAVSAESLNSVKFSFAAVGEYFGVSCVKITAFRLNSLKIMS
ncbi:MAG TPA: hypothetical protein VFP97_16995 [Chitinophagaceae bacterium]|nr:hypothetical protein [Chitinophagaceae bacterium]